MDKQSKIEEVSNSKKSIEKTKSGVKNNKNIKKYIGGLIGFVIALLLFQFFFNSTSIIDKQLSKMANEINTHCPMMADEETRMDNVLALPDKTIQYNYTLVNLEKDKIDINLIKESLRPSILNIIETDPSMKTLRDIDVTFIYNYRDKNSIHVIKFTFTPEEYKTNAE